MAEFVTPASEHLHDVLVATFRAIAEVEEKPVEQAVEEFFGGWLEGGLPDE